MILSENASRNLSDSPLFSVIMRTFNRSAYLAEAIESVLGQIETDFELIVCDDGSTDSTPKLMEYYLARDRRVVYLQKPHTGIADTGNYAIARSKGKIIVQADSDDVQLPTKLSVAKKGLVDSDFTYSGFYYCNPKGEVWKEIHPKEFTIENIKRNEACAGESLSYWKYVWEKTPYRTELEINDDAGFLVDLYKAGWKWSIMDEPTFKYRMMKTSTSYARKAEVDELTPKIYQELDGTTDGIKIA